MSHIGYLASNLIRCFAYGITGGRFIFVRGSNKKIKKCMRQLTRMSAALALLADVSLILLGGSLKRRERISARLGDIMSHLYLASTVLKYYHDHQEPASDVDYVQWCVEECLYKIQQACDSLLNNYPYWALSKFLKWIIFPLGRAYRQPSDKLHHSIVEPMIHSGELRDRLTQHTYLSHEQNDLLTRLDLALSQISSIEPIQKKLSKALHDHPPSRAFDFTERMQFAREAGILTEDEIRQLSEFEILRHEIIQVNEFSFDLHAMIA
jgi:hypothetical protein